METHVMIDLETMSLRHDAAIIALGAVKFDPRAETVGTFIGAPFYMTCSLKSSQDAGLHVDAGTVMWWLEQDGQARDELRDNNAAGPLDNVLNEFFIWFGQKSLPTWGNGAGFDNVILRNAYRAFGGYCPFRYKHDRCYRTISGLFPNTVYAPPAIAHHALHDAQAQATHLQRLFNFIARG